MNNNISAGVFFYCKSTNRFLYLLRSESKHTNAWGIPGGKIESDETLLEGIIRECEEEIGFFPKESKLIPIQKFTNKNFSYHTFFCEVNEEFIPNLNEEHCGYCWVVKGQYPKPLHPGLFSTINFDVVQAKIETLTNY